ncbi:MAG: ABC transporter permease [Paludibaculum sp.]
MALLSLMDKLLLKPLPVQQADRLVQLVQPGAPGGFPQESFSRPLIAQLAVSAESAATILTVGYPRDEFVAYGNEPFQPEPARIQTVDVKAFDLLGIQLAMGRGFQSADSDAGAESVAILSHAFWQRRFGGSPDVLGKRFRRHGTAVTIVGVLSASFSELDLGSPPDAWLPVGSEQGGRLLAVLRPDSSPRQLEVSLRPAWEEYRKKESLTPGRQRNARDRQHPLIAVDASKGMQSGLRTRFVTPLTTLTLAALILLVIGCANSGLLLVALHNRRRREIAVRMALGASRWRLVRQLVVETTLLSSAASLVGALLAPFTARALVGLASDPDRPIRIAWHWDWRFAAVAFTCCAFATAFSTALPALRLPRCAWTDSGRDPFAMLRLHHFGISSGALFIAGQAGLAVVLWVGGGLLQTTWRNLDLLDPGFEQQRLSIAELQWEHEGNRAYTNTVYRSLLAQLAALPGLARVSLSGWSYFGGNSRRASIVPENSPGEAAGEPSEFLSVAPGFFTTMGVRLLRGRDFTTSDTEAAPLVAILNESAMRLYFGDPSAVGRRFSLFDPKQKLEIVGVVENTKLNGLREPAPPMVYLPFFQSEFRGTGDMPASLEIQTVPGAHLNLQQLYRVIQSSAPGIGVRRVRTQHELVERSLRRERLLAVVSVSLALFALLIAALGLGGTVAQSVSSRRRELAIRLALGASATNLIGDGVSRALLPVAAGVVTGSLLALFLANLLKSMLFGVEPSNPFVLAGAALLLLAFSAAAALVPLAGTIGIDPASSLRHE